MGSSVGICSSFVIMSDGMTLIWVILHRAPNSGKSNFALLTGMCQLW